MIAVFSRKLSWRETAAAILVAAAACAFAHFTSRIFFEWDTWVEQSLNRIEWVLAFPPGTEGMPDEHRGRVSGVDYRIACGASEDMGREAMRLQDMLRSQSGQRGAPGGITCLVRLSLNQREYLSGPWIGKIGPDAVLQDASVLNDDFSYTTNYAFLGSRMLATRIAQLAVIFAVLLLFGSLAALRADALRAWTVVKERMYMVLVPYGGAIVVRLVLLAIDRLASGILPASAPGIVDTLSMTIGRHGDLFRPLVYAPIVEEIIFRYALFTLLCRWWSPLAAAVMASAVFAASHLELYDTQRTITLFASGMLLQWLYVRYRSVTLCVAAHGMQNGATSLARVLNNWY